MIHDSSFFTKMGFNVMHGTSGDKLFFNTTVYQMLWEYRSNLLRTAKKLVPFMVPVENSGILETV